MSCKSIVFYYYDSLRNMEQQRHPNENPRVTSTVEVVLRDCKSVEGLFLFYHLNWRLGHTELHQLLCMLQGFWKGRKLLNCVGKQKMGKADVVLTPSSLNLITCFLTSSIYLMKSVTILYFVDMYDHKVIFKILVLFRLLRHTWTSHSEKK